MATYNVTVTVNGTSSSGNTTTQNVQVGDTINLTATYSTSGTWNATPTDCEVDGSTSVSTGNVVNTSLVVDEFTGSTYNVLVSHNVGGDGTTFRYANLSGSVTAAADNTPENYSALAGTTSNAEISTTHYATFSSTAAGTSSPGTGFSIGTQVDNGTAISVAAGEYRINTGSWTSAAGTVNQNDTVYYRIASSSSYSTEVTGSLTIGSVTHTFSLTTRASNTTPTGWNDLTLGDKGGVELGAIWYTNFDGTFTSTSPGAGFTMAGLDSDITVTTSGTGDAIRKNNGSWTAADTTFSNSDVLYARITASSSYSSGRTQTLGAGGGNAKDWTLTTKATPTPNAFDLGDETGTIPNSAYTSSTITLAGLDSGQSVTVSFTSDASGTSGYYKNGTLQSGNTTGSNGDEFYVFHTANTGADVETTSTLTAGGTSDDFTTTNVSNTAGWSVSSNTSNPGEGDQVLMIVNAPTSSGASVDFWWSVSPTDVDASEGNGSTTYSAPTKGVPIASNIGGFNFTADEDYTDEGAAGSGAITYTVNVYSNSNRTVLVASTTVDIADSSLPLPPDRAINSIGNQTFNYLAGSDNGHSVSIVNGETHTTYASAVDGTTDELGTVKGAGTSAATLTVSDDNIGPGNATTFQILARRTVADLGNNVAFVTDPKRTYTISRRAQTPSISAALDSDPDDDDVTINWTLTNGDGGTLQYSTDNANWTNGSTFAQAAKRGTEYTLYARTNATVVSLTASANFTPPYNPPDSSIDAIASPDQAYNSTTYTVPISGGNAVDEYFVYNNTGTANFGSRTGDGDIEITHGVAAGGAATFRVYVRRPIAVGGNNGFVDTGTTFEVEVRPGSPSLSVTDDDAENANVTVTLSASAGDGAASYEYRGRPDGVTYNAFGSTTEYTQARSTTTADYGARSVGANGLTSTVTTVSNYNPGYIAPVALTVADFDTDFNTASHDLTVTDLPANDNYEVHTGSHGGGLQGSSAGGGGTATTLSVTQTNTGGDDVVYYIRGYRATDKGGDGNYDNMDTYVVGEKPQNPSLSVTDDDAEDANVTVTLSASGGTGAASYQYRGRPDGVTYNAFGSTTEYTQARSTTTADYGARSVGTNGLTSTVTTVSNYNPGYIAPVGLTVADFDTDFNTASHDLTVTDLPANDNYEVRTGSYGGTLRGSSAGGGGTATTLSVTQTNTGGDDVVYYIRGYRATDKGGDGNYDNMDTYVVGERPEVPTGITGFVDQGTEANLATFTVTYGGTTGANTSTITTNADYTTGAVANGSNLANIDRDGDTLYARNTGANGLIADAALTTNATYLSPDNTITITPSSQSLGATDTSFNITISDITADKGMYYQVRDSSGTIHENGTPAAGQTSFTLTVTDTPNANPETYDVFSKRLKSSGGGDTYADSGNDFQVAPSGGVTDSAPVISSISQSAGSSSNLKDLTVNLSSTGSGGTALEYASSTSNLLPSSGDWQPSATFADRTVGTTYYFWASRNKNTSLFSSSVSYTPSSADYGIIIRNASGQTIVDSRSDKQSTVIKVGSVVIPGTTSTVSSGKTYITIATLNAALYGAPNTTVGTEWTATSNGTFSSGTVAEIVTVTGITGMRTTNFDIIDVITQTPGLVGISNLYTLRRAFDSFEVYQATVTNYTLNYIAVRY